jgi:hypothetical protein
MNYYHGDKLSGKESREDRRCVKCDVQPLLVLTMLDPRSGKNIRSNASVVSVLGVSKAAGTGLF